MERQEGTAKSPAPESRYRWHAFVMIGLLLLACRAKNIPRHDFSLAASVKISGCPFLRRDINYLCLSEACFMLACCAASNLYDLPAIISKKKKLRGRARGMLRLSRETINSCYRRSNIFYESTAASKWRNGIISLLVFLYFPRSRAVNRLIINGMEIKFRLQNRFIAERVVHLNMRGPHMRNAYQNIDN